MAELPKSPQSSVVLDDHAPHDSKKIVEEGYDQMAQRYLDWTTSGPSPRIGYVEKLLKLLPQNSKVLELGCGAGVPTTKMLAQHAQVTANDISVAQIALAQQNVPDAELIHSDMMSLSFPASTFGAVCAFYSIIHLPRAEQEILLKRISGWLSPGGYFLVNLGTTDNPGAVAKDWLGSKMYWSGFDEKTYLEMVKREGFELLEKEIVLEDEDGKVVPFLWILAKKESESSEKTAS